MKLSILDFTVNMTLTSTFKKMPIFLIFVGPSKNANFFLSSFLLEVAAFALNTHGSLSSAACLDVPVHVHVCVHARAARLLGQMWPPLQKLFSVTHFGPLSRSWSRSQTQRFHRGGGGGWDFEGVF